MFTITEIAVRITPKPLSRFAGTRSEVQLPETVLVDIDAETGEIDRLFYKNYPLVITITAPTVSKAEAEASAHEHCTATDVESVETKLIVFPGEPPKYDRQALAWKVVLWVKGEPTARARFAVIDAHTGELLEGTAPLYPH